jgi:hypothetical protein
VQEAQRFVQSDVLLKGVWLGSWVDNLRACIAKKQDCKVLWPGSTRATIVLSDIDRAWCAHFLKGMQQVGTIKCTQV